MLDNYANNSARILKHTMRCWRNTASMQPRVRRWSQLGRSDAGQLAPTRATLSTWVSKLFRLSPPIPSPSPMPIPVLYIDGNGDNQRSADSAKNAVERFRAVQRLCRHLEALYADHGLHEQAA